MHDIVEGVTALAAVGAVLVSFFNSRKIQQIHILFNSRMDQLLTLTATSARANGVVQGRKDLQDEHDAGLKP